MGKTKDLGHLASMALYDVSGNMTLPAGLKINGSADVATQSYVGTQLGSYIPSTRSITINGTTYDLSADRSWTITSMIYPSAGIALSTGSAWGTSITNNSTNWNTAYGWGNHASAGYLTGITSAQVTTALGYTPYNSTNPNGYITSSSLSSYLPLSGGTMTGIITFSATTGNKIDFYYSGDDRYGIQVQSSELRIHSGAQGASTGGITFGKSTGTTFTEHLRIKNDGNVQVVVGSLSMATSGTSYIRMGAFPNSTSNSGEAWIGRASDRNSGTMTVQLGGGSSSSRSFEVVDYAWTTVLFSVGSNGNITTNGNIYMTNSNYAFGTSYWAGGGGYPGYQYTGGNTRFGFSSTSGYVDVYTDGNFYAGIDLNGSNNLVLHAGNYSGYAVIATGRTNWNSYNVIGNVVGQLAWKNYGNNHTIFDASAGTSPDGGSVNNTNANTYWSASYPTLMGWNGSSTYGVRVDTSRYADSAGSAGSASSAGSLSTNASATDIYNNGWFRNNNNLQGIYNQALGVHFYGNSSEGWAVTGSGTNVRIAFYSNHQTSLRGYVYADTSNNIGFLDNGGSWSFRTNGGTVYSYAYRGKDNVAGTGEASYHPAGVYVPGTNWLYGTTYKNGTTTSGQGWLYMDWNYGMSIVGVYSSVRLQGVWAMGDSYKLSDDGTSAGNLYGLAWSHPNAGGQAGYLTNHGLIHMMYGTAFATISDNIWCRNNITAYSDIRVKENIEVIPNAMEKINAIRGVTFTRNDVPDTSKRHAGVIAQEVEKVLPEVITTNYSNGHLSVAYGNMVGLTIEGLKEHDIKINEQQKTIGILLNQIEYLKTIINGITK